MCVRKPVWGGVRAITHCVYPQLSVCVPPDVCARTPRHSLGVREGAVRDRNGVIGARRTHSTSTEAQDLYAVLRASDTNGKVEKARESCRQAAGRQYKCQVRAVRVYHVWK